MPQPVHAQYKGLVQCDGVTSGTSSTATQKKCNFDTLVESIQYLIKWLFAIAGAVSIILFTYAGFLYVTGVESNINKAKGIFGHVILGMVLMLCAWFIVYTIVTLIGKDDSAFTSLLKK